MGTTRSFPRSYTEYESKHFESYTQSFLVKGNSSVVYCLEWKSVMKTRNSSRVENPLIKMPDRSGSSHEEFVIRRKKRQKKDADVRSQEDIIDMIERKYGGLDSAEQGCSSRVAAPKKPTSAGLCSACRKLYQRVKRLKKPMKDKLLDNDPTSLTCDQWVLLKDWHPTRLPQSGGKLSPSLRKIGRRKKQPDEAETFCSRPRVFLQRNLRRPRKIPATKKEKRKRRRTQSRGPSAAKKMRYHGDPPLRDSSSGDCSNDSFHSGEHPLEDFTNVVARTTETATPTQSGVPRRQSAERGFRDLLAQLRGNSSMIFQESH
ncbi:uncharacterized protein si:ch211-227n13.3 isoform X2 [Nerophis ophidion]|uniref:uncharacterized protein si:ch211-227n13.3 isoform X2 n=1 Tax=Nerophis ophidion TaxID=159077 RepID=UPI002ADF035F|nr:uncharacterized protein si:ch211-227n13.3 isoform X2 [Nerophis ophidion]XP_061746110.1 uncharacterized protein si:ch211-227n13.3 isoform X2 [Nerophis ophidion]XP_061746111.1 uncharacterized protein si:ch211-227n13.3 isoform X2 [Nerophis ophidion]